jgi:hypothetical protein
MERNTKPTAKLPSTWRTGDGSANAGKELMAYAGPHTALFLHESGLWFVVRYLNEDRDKFHRNSIGEMVETYPWRRAIEVIGAGRSPDECLWQLRSGICRAMVGGGFRPIVHNDEWIGFTDARGKPVQGGQLLFGAPRAAG